MDRVLTVRRSFLNELRGFCNRFASMCDGCCRRPCDCRLSDDIHKAKALIVVIDNLRDAEEERFYVENPFDDICDKIIAAIRQGGGKPVCASNIVIPGVYRQRKCRTIKSLLKSGRIEMTLCGGKPFYVVCEDDVRNRKHNQHNNTQKGERYGV